jgi:hypothetical protein
VKHKMFAVCYDDAIHEEWVPYTGSIYHFRRDALARKRGLAPHTGRILTVTIEVVMPKRRTAKNRGNEE